MTKITVNGKRLHDIPLRQGKKTKISMNTTFIKHCSGGLTRAIRQGNEIEGMHIENNFFKIIFLHKCKIMYIENHKKNHKTTSRSEK